MNIGMIVLAAVLGALLAYQAADPEDKYLMMRWAERRSWWILAALVLLMLISTT